MSKPGHSFVRLPLEPADPWFRLRYAERALGADMFRVFGNEERLDVELSQVAEVVCRRLAVDGRDRPTVKRSVERLIAAGLLVRDGQVTRLLYSRESYRQWSVNGQSMVSERTVNEQSMVSEPTVNGQSSASENDLSISNDSNDALQIDREIERKKERESARAPGAPKDFPDRTPSTPLAAAGSAHGAEARDGWAAAWFAAGQGEAPVLVGQTHAAAVEFARRVAKSNEITLYEAAYAIAAHVIANGKRGRDDAFDLARMDPFAAENTSKPGPKSGSANVPNAAYNPRLLP